MFMLIPSGWGKAGEPFLPPSGQLVYFFTPVADDRLGKLPDFGSLVLL